MAMRGAGGMGAQENTNAKPGEAQEAGAALAPSARAHHGGDQHGICMPPQHAGLQVHVRQAPGVRRGRVQLQEGPPPLRAGPH
eukprot:5010118-Pyramimonas_sp.AAC.1